MDQLKKIYEAGRKKLGGYEFYNLVEKCLIEDDVLPLLPPPPPPMPFMQRPIHPMMGLFGGGQKINSSDLLVGIGGLKKPSVNDQIKI